MDPVEPRGAPTPPVEAASTAEAERPPPSTAGIVVRILLGLVAGLTVAGGVGYLQDISPGKVVEYVAEVPPLVVVGCAASALAVLALQAVRWHLVMSPLLGLGYRKAYQAQMIGQMFNAFLPARAGDLLRVQYLGRRTGKSRATILGTEFVDRWLDWWGWIPILLVMSLVTDLPWWLYRALSAFGALLFAMGATFLVLTRRGWTPRPGTRLGAIFGSLRAGLAAFKSRRMLAISLAVAPLPWAWEVGALIFTARGFGIHLTPAMAFSTLMGFNLATIVPSPGGLGTVEGGGTKALVWFGVDPNRAMAFITVYHLCQLLPSVIGGVLILVAEGERLFGKGAAPAASTAPEAASAVPETQPERVER